MRNRLLDSVIFLVPKPVHGLVYSDICPDDRQNYNSLEKIMQSQIRKHLATFVMGSEGTIEYLRICHEITSSLYDDSLSPLERLSRIWRPLFFIRAWRLWIKRATTNLDSNFITRNAYQCIELNAKNLVILIKKFRDEGMSKFFHPTVRRDFP